MKTRLIILSLFSLLLTACGGSSSSSSTPPANPTGYWTGKITHAGKEYNDVHFFFYQSINGYSYFGTTYKGNAKVHEYYAGDFKMDSNQAIISKGENIVNRTSSPGIIVNNADFKNFLPVINNSNSKLTVSPKSSIIGHLGQESELRTLNLSYDASNDLSLSLTSLAGVYRYVSADKSQQSTITFTSNGSISASDNYSGCAISGKITLIPHKYSYTLLSLKVTGCHESTFNASDYNGVLWKPTNSQLIFFLSKKGASGSGTRMLILPKHTKK